MTMIAQDRSICIMGQGYVGLTLAVAMADVGLDVLGVEINDTILTSLQLKLSIINLQLSIN